MSTSGIVTSGKDDFVGIVAFCWARWRLASVVQLIGLPRLQLMYGCLCRYLDGGRDDMMAILSRVIANSHLLTAPLVMQNQELLHGPRMKGRGGVRVSSFT